MENTMNEWPECNKCDCDAYTPEKTSMCKCGHIESDHGEVGLCRFCNEKHESDFEFNHAHKQEIAIRQQLFNLLVENDVKEMEAMGLVQAIRTAFPCMHAKFHKMTLTRTGTTEFDERYCQACDVITDIKVPIVHWKGRGGKW
jgi:hypothetical protein